MVSTAANIFESPSLVFMHIIISRRVALTGWARYTSMSMIVSVRVWVMHEMNRFCFAAAIFAFCSIFPVGGRLGSVVEGMNFILRPAGSPPKRSLP